MKREGQPGSLAGAESGRPSRDEKPQRKPEKVFYQEEKPLFEVRGP